MKKSILISFILITCIFSSCKEEIIKNEDDNNKNDLKSLLLSTGSGDYDGGSFFLLKEKSTTPFFLDSLTTPDTMTVGWNNRISSWLGENSEQQAVYVKVNNSSLNEIDFTSGYYNYVDFDSPTVYFEGTSNLLEWKIGSNTYYDTVAFNIGTCEITTPTYLTTINTNNSLNITWSTSANPNDQVLILVHEIADMSRIPMPSSLYSFTSSFEDDDGSYTVSSSEMSNFSTTYVIISLMRFQFKEVEHGGEDYLFVSATKHITTVKTN